jgi:hypothetical protein
MRTEHFVSNLRAVSLKNVFNPYSDRCEIHDVPDAPERRARALLHMLNAAAETDVDAIWIGRDLGYRGGRRTGLALTDDIHLTVHATRWSVTIERPTTGSMVAERTAAVVWSMLASVTAHVFLWNVFPFHPHEPGDPFTNRSHGARERAVGETILAELILILRPRRVVCIGNDAARAALRLCGLADVVQVRHPSYGGQREFASQVGCLYDVKAQTSQLSLVDQL